MVSQELLEFLCIRQDFLHRWHVGAWICNLRDFVGSDAGLVRHGSIIGLRGLPLACFRVDGNRSEPQEILLKSWKPAEILENSADFL